MMLHCTLVPAPGSALTGERVELAIAVPAGCPGSRLQDAVSRRYGTGDLSVDGSPVATLRAGTAPLVHGAVLVDSLSPVLARSGGRCPGATALLLAVHSGPGAGTVVPLQRGRFRIGRSGTEIVIPDAELSREHARLDVSDSAVSIVDLDSANGTFLDGRKVRKGPVTTGSLIRCGSSTMSLIFDGAALQPGRPDPGITAGTDISEPLVVSNTAAGSNRTALVLAAGLPLALGIGLALMTGMWMFLAFTAVSALAVLVPAASGRRQRRELGAAVAAAAGQDAERRRRAAPSAADLVLGMSLQAPGAHPAGEAGPVWLRLGLAQRTANIRLEPAVPGFRPPSLGPLPLMLDPATAVTALRGPEPAVAGLVRSLIIQLAGYPRGRRTRILVHGSADSVPLAARFLDGVTLSCHAAALADSLAAGPGEGFDRGMLIVLGGTGAAPAARPAADGASALHASALHGSALHASAAGHGWQVIDCSTEEHPAAPPPAGNASIVLDGRTARLSTGRDETIFVPDLVPQPAFDRCCRRLGSGSSTAAARLPAVPDACTLDDILPLLRADISRRWAGTRRTPGLPVPVGTGRTGPLVIDLQADGPHFLVAGTTGSGKSEFLRTLAVGLAASYPPDRINLLFIDFKGGSGLGPLTGLPHCVGMLTDLGTNEVERTLVSLRAEVRRREEVLAAAQATDITAYEGMDPPLPALPHLVVVIDEFRMLVEEAPAALSGLMKVAAIGRSLGIHLVMATQRAQGAITADIRANVTSSVALRVQSDPESLDIMDSRLAAAIPIGRPGRAFLVRGTEAPQEFQTATLTAPKPGPAGGTVTVFPVKEVLCRPPAGPRAAGAEAEDTTAVPEPVAQSLAQGLSELWTALGGIPPRPPVAAPLPVVLPFPQTGSGAPGADRASAGCGPGPGGTALQGGGSVRLGWVDVPEQQRVTELCWRPAVHGHLGLVGGSAGAGDAALALGVDQLLAGEDEAHLYFLDASGAFSAVVASARVGAVAGLHELRRAVRVLERIAEEVTRRLAAPAPDGQPPVVLIIAGWGSWASAFRSGPQAWAEDLVHDIVRDGPKAAVTVVVSGERELVTARFFAAIPNRVFFPAGSTDESRLAWPRLPALEPAPGRAAVSGIFVPARPSEGYSCQVFERPVPAAGSTVSSGGNKPPACRPFRIEALPPLVTVAEVLARLGPPAGAGHALPADRPGTARTGAAGRANVSLRIGVGGDELLPVAVPLPAGSVLAVLGGPAAGKSTLLAALPGLNPSVRDWLAPGGGTDPGKFWSEVQARALAGKVARDAVLMADDLDLQPAETNSLLYELNGLGWTVIMTAGFGPALQQRVPLALSARSLGKGILICPRGPLDGDFFGVRFEPEPGPPPGRAVVILDGRPAAVQLAAAQPAAARAG